MTLVAKWPDRHWAGRCAAVKVLREYVNNMHPTVYLSHDEATAIMEQLLQAYLQETQKAGHAAR